jgi:hypothetical protein
MRIVAKYAGKCERCGGGFPSGASIEWEKGKGSRHVACPAKSSPAPASPRQRKEPAKQPEGSVYISRRSQDRHDNYAAGDVLHCAKIPGGGGDDGRYWTVLVVLPKHKDDDTDEWMIAAYARPSTDTECADLIAARQKKEGHASLLKELRSLAETGIREGDVACPAGRELVLDAGAHGSGRVVAVLREDGAVSVWCSGYYDDYIRSCFTARDPRAAEILTGLLPAVTEAA